MKGSLLTGDSYLKKEVLAMDPERAYNYGAWCVANEFADALGLGASYITEADGKIFSKVSDKYLTVPQAIAEIVRKAKQIKRRPANEGSKQI